MRLMVHTHSSREAVCASLYTHGSREAVCASLYTVGRHIHPLRRGVIPPKVYPTLRRGVLLPKVYPGVWHLCTPRVYPGMWHLMYTLRYTLVVYTRLSTPWGIPWWCICLPSPFVGGTSLPVPLSTTRFTVGRALGTRLPTLLGRNLCAKRIS